MKTTILIICTALISLTCNSQSLFEAQLSTEQNASYYPVYPNGSSVRTNDGGFIFMGETSTYTSLYEYTINIYKFDKNGKPQWSKFYKTTNYSRYSTIVQTTDGGYAIAGFLNVLKLDSLGKLLWSKSYSRLLFYAHSNINVKLINAADGSLILGGSADGGAEYSGRLYILNLNSTNGNIITFHAYSSLSGYHEQFGDIYRTTDNGYIVCGTNWDKNNNFGLPNMLILKVSSSFNPEWERIIKGRYYTDYSIDYATDAIETFDGSYVITGYSYASYDSVTRIRTNDACVIKLDKNGNQLWKKHIGNTLNDQSNAITKTDDSSFVMAGYSNAHALIFKINDKGELKWAHSVGEPKWDYFSSLIKSSDNTLTASGISHSFGADNGSFFISRFDQDGNSCGNVSTPVITINDFPDTIFSAPVYNETLLNTTITNLPLQLITLKTSRNILCKSNMPVNKMEMRNEGNVYAGSSFSISVFPNPVSSGVLNIKFNYQGAGIMKLLIYDAKGNNIFTKDILAAKQQSINISQLNAGFYLLKAISGNMQATAKFIKID